MASLSSQETGACPALEDAASLDCRAQTKASGMPGLWTLGCLLPLFSQGTAEVIPTKEVKGGGRAGAGQKGRGGSRENDWAG